MGVLVYPRTVKKTVKEKIRFLLSFAPRLGIVPKASKFREKGISAFIRVKDEEYWIRPCILSIKDYVEEILVIDNGSVDGTLDKVGRLRHEVSTPIRIYSLPGADYCEISNLGIKESKYNWLLKWDADFIAHTDGPMRFDNLRNYLFSLDQCRYHMIFMNIVNLAGDLWHQPKRDSSYIRSSGPIHREAYLWSFSPKMRYVWKDYNGISKTESLLFPPYYRFLQWPELSVFHVGGVRSIERMLADHFWGAWKLKYAKNKEESIPDREAFAWQSAEQLFHTSKEEIILRKFFDLLKTEFVPYDKQKYGPHPEWLSSYLENPRYRILYDKKKSITGRYPDCI